MKTLEENIEQLREVINQHSATIKQLADISNKRKHKIEYLEARLERFISKLESASNGPSTPDSLKDIFGGFNK